MSKRKINKNVLYVIAFIVITIISLIYKTILGVIDKPITVVTETDLIEETLDTIDILEETSIEVISVYICGEVNNPGVYEINRGSILNDVVNLAGGLTERADINHINLVYIINSNISIYIPNENENQESEIIFGDITFQSDDEDSLININTATLDELMTLPGIGQSTANRIIEYRENNAFTRIEDIMNVTGIGEAKFNSIRELICV